MIICAADLDQIVFLHFILLWFEIVSSLKINMGKFELVLMAVVPDIDLLVDVLGCK